MSDYFDYSYTEDAGADSSNIGKILTSTRWNQSGTVYVSVNGKQTALNGYSYNKFCPNDTNGNRSVTGCKNTTDSQILYYWIEKGYDFDLSVSTDNYFKLKSNSSTYYVSNSPKRGEGTLSNINSILASKSRIGNGNFIAALNFFCGVYNHSSYGSSSTSTSYTITVSSSGSGAAAFVAAGFDSYYFIAREASGSVPGKFFTGETGLTDLCLSILRENLDYGEPIEIGVPSHSIYMDGYRRGSSGQYEYHLNYGWGVNSSRTDWYTKSELEDEEIKYVLIDLSPDVKIHVTSARNDYYGGSFLRGMERLNHIVNTKNTTFTFASALAGKTITLSSAAQVTSNVGVSFKNICVSLATTGNTLFSSSRSLGFDVAGGSLIVNSSSPSFLIRETGNATVSLSIRDGFAYIGSWSGGIAGVQSELYPYYGDYSYQDFDNSFYASVQGVAVKSGSAADTVTLKSNAALFGKLDLGSGNNRLNVGSGSLFYGGFTGSANTLTVTLTIDVADCPGAAIALADASSENAFRQATGGVLNLNFSAIKSKSRTYDLLYCVNSATASLFSVKLTAQGKTVTLNCDGNDESGYFRLVSSGPKLALEYVPTPPEVLTVTPSTLQPTNKTVTVKASFSADATLAQYSTDNKKWLAYTSAGVTLSSNGQVYFRAQNATGLYSAVKSFKVTNIDKTPPVAPTVKASTTKLTNQDVTVTATFSADSAKKQYSTDNKTWQNYTAALTAGKNGTYYFRAADAAGNVSGVTSFKVSNIDKTPPAAPTAKASTTKATNKNVTITATFSADSAKKQYSTDNKTWQNYVKAVTATANGVFYFRGVDAAGNASGVRTLKVTNIDKTPPVAPTVKASTTAPTNKKVTVTASFSSDTAKKQYSTDKKSWKTYSKALVTDKNLTYYFRGTDAVGNNSKITSFKVSNIDRKPPAAPTAKASTTKLTNKDVTITAAFSADSAKKQYSTDNKTWKTYTDALTASKNGTYYFRGVDAAGNKSAVKTLQVANIDKTAPAAPTAKASTTKATKGKVTITAAFSADSAKKQYSTDNKTWKAYTKALTASKNGTYYFRGVDAAGNASKVRTVKVANIVDTTNNSWADAALLSGTVLGALDKTADRVDFYDVDDVSRLALDMESGKARVTFCDVNRQAVAVDVLCADGSAKFLAEIELVFGDLARDNITMSDTADAVKYLKIESVTDGMAAYRLAKLA